MKLPIAAPSEPLDRSFDDLGVHPVQRGAIGRTREDVSIIEYCTPEEFNDVWT